MSKKAAFILLSGALAITGCRTAAPIYTPSDVTFAPAVGVRAHQLSMADYRDAIIRAGARRGWTFDEAGPGHLIGNVAVRGKHFAMVDVLFDTNDFTINYKDSRNLEYDASRGEIHPNYNSWITYLRDEIQAEVANLKAS